MEASAGFEPACAVLQTATWTTRLRRQLLEDANMPLRHWAQISNWGIGRTQDLAKGLDPRSIRKSTDAACGISSAVVDEQYGSRRKTS